LDTLKKEHNLTKFEAMELIYINSRKSIQEMTLPNSNSQSKKGLKGFQKSINPKTIKIGLLVTPQCKSFIDSYCELNNISLTKLMLASLECFTGYNGSNHEDILNTIDEMIERDSQ
jgi:hypothetical protein